MVNDETWNQFSIRTAEEGTNKSAKIRELIEDYLGLHEKEEKTPPFQELIPTRTTNGIINYRAIEYISRRTSTNIEEIINYIKYETEYLINYEGN